MMTSKEDYAHWCLMLINGEDFVVSEILSALFDDGYINKEEEWSYADEEEG